jgi:hypothetical protein
MRRLVLAVLLGSAFGCHGEHGTSGATPGGGATEPAAPGVAGKSVVATTLAWNDSAAGSVLLVAGSNATEGAVVFPHFNDSTLGTVTALGTGPVNGAHVDLFARGGPVGQAIVTIATTGTLTGDCTAWPPT